MVKKALKNINSGSRRSSLVNILYHLTFSFRRRLKIANVQDHSYKYWFMVGVVEVLKSISLIVWPAASKNYRGKIANIHNYRSDKERKWVIISKKYSCGGRRRHQINIPYHLASDLGTSIQYRQNSPSYAII